MKNVYIIGGNDQYDSMFMRLGFNLVDVATDADLICFTGGSDVSPSLYGEQPHPQTWSDRIRDEVETGIFHLAKVEGIPMVGICRGGQFLHVMNGGKMYQHVDGHATGRTHKLRDVQTGEEHSVTSTHHQMMRYEGLGEGELVAYADESSFKETMSDDGIIDEGVDVEVMWYKDTNCLCFQPHPEFIGADSTYLYFKNLLTRYWGVEDAA
jgi:gamma-glutamyl-gamma-aminobutyrate hydrolase PuuD